MTDIFKVSREALNRPMQVSGEVRYVEMAPGVRVLEQRWVEPGTRRGEWRPVPVMSRKEAGYGDD